MNTQGWMEPGSEEDMALHSLKSLCAQVMDPKYRETYIAEARLSEEIHKVHELTVKLMGYLAEIKQEADERAFAEALADRVRGFA